MHEATGMETPQERHERQTREAATPRRDVAELEGRLTALIGRIQRHRNRGASPKTMDAWCNEIAEVAALLRPVPRSTSEGLAERLEGLQRDARTVRDALVTSAPVPMGQAGAALDRIDSYICQQSEALRSEPSEGREPWLADYPLVSKDVTAFLESCREVWRWMKLHGFDPIDAVWRAGRLASTPPSEKPEPDTDPKAAYMNARTCICGEDASKHHCPGAEEFGFDPDWAALRRRYFDLRASDSPEREGPSESTEPEDHGCLKCGEPLERWERERGTCDPCSAAEPAESEGPECLHEWERSYLGGAFCRPCGAWTAWRLVAEDSNV